jgi:uncharacterized membrane protein YoaK (UPF0700 family)
MRQQSARIVSFLLSFVAGYVDSCSVLALFGLFVAQVTGSFVLASTQIVMLKPSVFLRFAEIFAFFLAGVATTVLVRSAEGRRRNALKSALALEGVLLTGLLILWIVYRPWPGPDTPTVLFASLLGLSAMGVQSALIRLLVRDSPSTNVMTTNITQFAIDTTEFVLSVVAAPRCARQRHTRRPCRNQEEIDPVSSGHPQLLLRDARGSRRLCLARSVVHGACHRDHRSSVGLAAALS